MARLLLVDDEPAMLFALKELTKQRRHEAVLARSAQEALAQLEGVDAVVTDYAMPVPAMALTETSSSCYETATSCAGMAHRVSSGLRQPCRLS